MCQHVLKNFVDEGVCCFPISEKLQINGFKL